MPSPRRRRLAAGLCAAAVVCGGLFVHLALPDGFATDATGDILYAVFIYLLLVVVAPRRPASIVAAIAFTWCTAVELFQLSGLPEAWGAAFAPVMLVLGTVFSPTDLLMYAIGILIALALDAAVAALARSRREHEAVTIVAPVDAEEPP
ncbi:DUF2809 domain-containing protein [Micromonospora sp. DT81.3]|uniref:ribosomal maturation YjgA family protein n=1 Tax=Actinomycetes TaxID=1760 RepID=UPI003CEDE110